MSLLTNQMEALEGEIESFLDNISKAGMLFGFAVQDYLNSEKQRFQQRLEQIGKLESTADDLRREIKYKLYTKMLIPDSRGDVLSLLENIDNVIDLTKKVVFQFDIEKPFIYDFLKKDFIELTEASVQALDNTVKAARAFFNNISIVNDYINKAYFYEHEADKIEERIKRKVFTSTEVMDLARRMHIRDFALYIARLSDEAEAVCERISVAAIKRTL